MIPICLCLSYNKVYTWQPYISEPVQCHTSRLGLTESHSNISGNFVTDAMVWAYREDNISLALINSGGIRASFDKGNITMEDLLISFPFRNTFDVVLIQGIYLRQAFENSVANMKPDGKNEAGRFLQESSLKHYET